MEQNNLLEAFKIQQKQIDALIEQTKLLKEMIGALKINHQEDQLMVFKTIESAQKQIMAQQEWIEEAQKILIEVKNGKL